MSDDSQAGAQHPVPNADALAGLVAKRRFPFPYHAMLAISSDIDRTTIDRFRAIHRFLNTREETPMGPGLGLDVADSMWVFPGRPMKDLGLLAGYERAPGPSADELTRYVRVGWIDTLHSYGNYTTNAATSRFERRHAEIAIEALEARGLALDVWVNHGSRTNIQNFGLGRWQEGDLPGSGAYHTDLLLAYGARFAWNHTNGRVPGLATPLEPMELRDRRRLWGFSRYTQIFGTDAVEVIRAHLAFADRRPSLKTALQESPPATMVWWPEMLDAQLSVQTLDSLVAGADYCVAAQHLGDLGTGDEFTPEAVAALSRLRDYQQAGAILVARTSRLLNYARVWEHVSWDVRGSVSELSVDIRAVEDPVLGTSVPSLDDLRGVTFHVPDPATTRLLLNGVALPDSELVRNPNDDVAGSIGVKWFDDDVTDYTEEFRRAAAPTARDPRFQRLEPFAFEELIETAVAVDLADFGLEHPLRSRYGPTHRNIAPLVFDGFPVAPDDVFLDLGSGKGRMLLVAAAQPFKRVLGVEIAAPLNAMAEENIRHNRGKLACEAVECITADACELEIPDDVTVAYFFNSFRGSVLEQTLSNLVASLDRNPRLLRFIALYPREADTIEATGRFVEVSSRSVGSKPLDRIVYYESVSPGFSSTEAAPQDSPAAA